MVKYISNFKSTKTYAFFRYHLKYKVSNKKIEKTKIFFKNNTLKIEKWESTIDKVVNENYSIARFGDGEFACMTGSMRNKTSGLNHCNGIIQRRLISVFNSDLENLLIGIIPSPSDPYGSYNLKEKQHWNEYVYTLHFKKILKLLNFSKVYADATVFLKPMGIDTILQNDYFNRVKKIWSNKEVCFVTSKKGRLDINHSLFDNVKSKYLIDTPYENAFDKYDDIFLECQNKNENTLFLLSAGFTATLLAYDLTKKGYQAIDIGHITHHLHSRKQI